MIFRNHFHFVNSLYFHILGRIINLKDYSNAHIRNSFSPPLRDHYPSRGITAARVKFQCRPIDIYTPMRDIAKDGGIIVSR